MKLSKAVIWLVVLAAAAGAYFLSLEAERKAGLVQDKETRAVTLEDPLNVVSLEVSGSRHPKSIRIERRDQEHRWQITAPLDCIADNMGVGRMLSDILDSRIQRRLQKFSGLADFGLKPAKVRIKLTDRSGGTSELMVGNLSPSQEYLYAASPQGKEIWFLPAKALAGLDQGLFQLRDKSALDFVVMDVNLVQIENGRGSLSLRRVKKGAKPKWEFSDGGQASAPEVDELLFGVHALRARAFEDQPTDLAAKGLNPPQAKIILGLSQEGEIGLLLGNKVASGARRLVRRLDGGPVMEVATRQLDSLKMSRFELAERRPWRLERDKIQSLEIVFTDHKLSYAKHQGIWRRVIPPGGEKSGLGADLLTWDLEALKWQKILPQGADYGFSRPQVTITVGLEGEPVKKQVLIIGKKDEQSGLLAAQIKGQTQVLGLDPKFIKNIPRMESKLGQKGS
ncbi:MAG: DUF4340 domain-containing protein [Desulfarculaceae bacterium]|jgi:hypothetical protein